MKVFNLDHAILIIKKLKQKGQRIVLVGGCFDVLHYGHKVFLEKAKKQGDILVVLLESDEKVRILKGEGRPVNKQKIRAESLAKVPEVDYVVLLSGQTDDNFYEQLIDDLSPNIIAVTADDPLAEKKKQQIKKVGGKLAIVIPRLKQFSSSKLIASKN